MFELGQVSEPTVSNAAYMITVSYNRHTFTSSRVWITTTNTTTTTTVKSCSVAQQSVLCSVLLLSGPRENHTCQIRNWWNFSMR